DDDVGPRERRVESLPGQRVNVGGGRGGDRVVALLEELPHDTGSDQTGAADHCDAHLEPPGKWCGRRVSRWKAGRPAVARVGPAGRRPDFAEHLGQRALAARTMTSTTTR